MKFLIIDKKNSICSSVVVVIIAMLKLYILKRQHIFYVFFFSLLFKKVEQKKNNKNLIAYLHYIRSLHNQYKNSKINNCLKTCHDGIKGLPLQALNFKTSN
jgi:hypothetical protein